VRPVLGGVVEALGNPSKRDGFLYFPCCSIAVHASFMAVQTNEAIS
jgi:hypothetical protein